MKLNLDSGVTLEYEVRGEANQKTILLVQGLAMQLIDWPEVLVDVLAETHRVVLFDNRDIGLSTKFDDCDINALRERGGFFEVELANSAPYTLFEMAGDAVQLMDALGCEKFSVLGYSMGGMIAQLVAALYRNRVQRLVSLMSSGGQPHVVSSAAARAAMELSAVPQTLDDALDSLLGATHIYAGSNHRICESKAAEHLRLSLARCYSPDGIYRQGLAVANTGDRRRIISTIVAPTLILHGDEDPCIDVSQAIEASQLIEGSNLCLLRGQGHDFPDISMERILTEVRQHLLGR